MSDKTTNDELAESAGSDKPTKQPIETYDSRHGKYEGQAPSVRMIPPVQGTVQPFKSTKS